MIMKRSPFFYVGDKYKLASQLCKIFPTNINRLIEPFCGGGSIFLNVKANKYLANDNSYYMIQLHSFLKSYAHKEKLFFKSLEELIKEYGFSASALNINVSDELKKKYPKTHYAIYNKSSYYKLREDFNLDKTNYFKLYLLLVYGFNHMLRFNSAGEFNLPVGDVDYNKNVKQAISNYLAFVRENDISFYCYDFETFLKKIRIGNDDFIYVDPPYLISNSEYNKLWNENEEKRLLNVLDKLDKKGIRFALSNVFSHKGLENTILIEWSKKYKVYDIKSNYISYHDNTVKNSKEVLITNF